MGSRSKQPPLLNPALGQGTQIWTVTGCVLGIAMFAIFASVPERGVRALVAMQGLICKGPWLIPLIAMQGVIYMSASLIL